VSDGPRWLSIARPYSFCRFPFQLSSPPMPLTLPNGLSPFILPVKISVVLWPPHTCFASTQLQFAGSRSTNRDIKALRLSSGITALV